MSSNTLVISSVLFTFPAIMAFSMEKLLAALSFGSLLITSTLHHSFLVHHRKLRWIDRVTAATIAIFYTTDAFLNKWYYAGSGGILCVFWFILSKWYKRLKYYDQAILAHMTMHVTGMISFILYLLEV